MVENAGRPTPATRPGRPKKAVSEQSAEKEGTRIAFTLTPEADAALLNEFGVRKEANFGILTMIHERYKLAAPVREETATEKRAREAREEAERIAGLEDENKRLKAELEALKKK